MECRHLLIINLAESTGVGCTVNMYVKGNIILKQLGPLNGADTSTESLQSYKQNSSDLNLN